MLSYDIKKEHFQALVILEKLSNKSLLAEKAYNFETKNSNNRFFRVSKVKSDEYIAYTVFDNQGRERHLVSKLGKYYTNFWKELYPVDDLYLEKFTKDFWVVAESIKKPRKNNNNWYVLRGESIIEAYRATPRPMGCKSCMTYPTGSNERKDIDSILKLYAENPERCGLLVYGNKRNWFCRTLLWKNDNGEYIHDRIYYPEKWKDKHVKEFEYFCIENNIREARNDDTVVVSFPSSEKFPYMDRFYTANYIDDKKIKLYYDQSLARMENSKGRYDLSMRDTYGDFNDRTRKNCCNCNKKIREFIEYTDQGYVLCNACYDITTVECTICHKRETSFVMTKIIGNEYAHISCCSKNFNKCWLCRRYGINNSEIFPLVINKHISACKDCSDICKCCGNIVPNRNLIKDNRRKYNPICLKCCTDNKGSRELNGVWITNSFGLFFQTINKYNQYEIQHIVTHSRERKRQDYYTFLSQAHQYGIKIDDDFRVAIDSLPENIDGVNWRQLATNYDKIHNSHNQGDDSIW